MVDILEGIDLSQVTKGTTFDVQLLTKHVGVSTGDRDYPRAILKFAAALATALDRLGRPATVCTQNDRVLVLTDDDALTYNDDHFHGYLRRAGVRNHRMKQVDIGKLSFPRRQEHDRALLIQNVMMQAVQAARREIERADHVRAHPVGPFGDPAPGEGV